MDRLCRSTENLNIDHTLLASRDVNSLLETAIGLKRSIQLEKVSLKHSNTNLSDL